MDLGKKPVKNIIELRNITKNYVADGSIFQAVKNINLDIKEGEFLAIIGHSGSGKSTLLKILGLLDQAFYGNYIFNGTDISAMDDDKKSRIRNENLGFVFQDFNLIKRMTVKENIALPLLYSGKGLKEAYRRAETLLGIVNLASKSGMHPNELSGGQQQRISIARALINDPKVIIADEPTGALDVKTTKEIMEIFRQINSEGTTIIMVTHTMEVAAYADRVVEISGGILTERGSEVI